MTFKNKRKKTLMTQKNTEYDYLFKMILIGKSGVGKTSLVIRYGDGQYTEGHISTIGVDFKIKSLETEGKKVKLQIWDTAGQERFRTITTNYYRGSQGVIVVFDTSDPDGIDSLRTWIEDIKMFDEDYCIMVIGNKSDLVSSEELRETKKKVEEILKETVENQPHVKNVEYVEASAKESINVDLAFEKLTSSIVKMYSEGYSAKKNECVLKEPQKKGYFNRWNWLCF